MMRVVITSLFVVVFSSQAASAQVVIRSDGSLPAASVSADDYPKMVSCTLDRRRADVEALLVARRNLYEAARSEGKFGPTREEYNDLEVETPDGRVVEESRYFVEIIESCIELKNGYPLGFWPNQLYTDWAEGLSFWLHARALSSSEFASCLQLSRPQLVEAYLSFDRGSSKADTLFKSMFEQGVCTPEMRGWIKEKDVRNALEKLRTT